MWEDRFKPLWDLARAFQWTDEMDRRYVDKPLKRVHIKDWKVTPLERPRQGKRGLKLHR